MLVENLLLWARDSKNKLFFLDRPEKYVLFWQPENFLGPQQAVHEAPLDDEARNTMIEVIYKFSCFLKLSFVNLFNLLALSAPHYFFLKLIILILQEFFSSGSVPEVEGPLFLKSEGKKAWKKFYFVLRASGLYYCPKGKSSRSSRDLVCLVTFENSQVRYNIDVN